MKSMESIDWGAKKVHLQIWGATIMVYYNNWIKINYHRFFFVFQNSNVNNKCLDIIMDHEGIEPSTSRLLDECSNQLS